MNDRSSAQETLATFAEMGLLEEELGEPRAAPTGATS